MLKKIIEISKKKGFSDFQVENSKSEQVTLEVQDGVISQNSMQSSSSLSFKGIYKGKAVFGYTQNRSMEIIDEVLDMMIKNAETLTINEPEFIYDGSKKYPKIPEHKFDFSKIPFENKIKLVKDLEKECKKIDNIEIVESCVYEETKSFFQLVNTKGINLEEETSYAVLYPIILLNKDNDKVDHYQVHLSYEFDFDPIKIAKECGEKANKKLGAISNVGNGNIKSVFSPKAMVSLLSAYFHNFTSNSRFNNKTKLVDKLNKQIANEKFTLIENALYEGAFINSAFDHEGVSTQKNVIVEKGIFKKFLNNLKMASIYKEEPTGNASDSNGISFHNLYVDKGKTKLSDLLKNVNDGIYIEQLSGLHAGIDSISGDFSLQSRGFVIENGEITKPYKMVVISGNFFKMLEDIVDIADDLIFPEEVVTLGSPSIYVKNLVVASSK